MIFHQLKKSNIYIIIIKIIMINQSKQQTISPVPVRSQSPDTIINNILKPTKFSGAIYNMAEVNKTNKQKKTKNHKNLKETNSTNQNQQEKKCNQFKKINSLKRQSQVIIQQDQSEINKLKNIIQQQKFDNISQQSQQNKLKQINYQSNNEIKRLKKANQILVQLIDKYTNSENNQIAILKQSNKYLENQLNKLNGVEINTLQQNQKIQLLQKQNNIHIQNYQESNQKDQMSMHYINTNNNRYESPIQSQLKSKDNSNQKKYLSTFDSLENNFDSRRYRSLQVQCDDPINYLMQRKIIYLILCNKDREIEIKQREIEFLKQKLINLQLRFSQEYYPMYHEQEFIQKNVKKKQNMGAIEQLKYNHQKTNLKLAMNYNQKIKFLELQLQKKVENIAAIKQQFINVKKQIRNETHQKNILQQNFNQAQLTLEADQEKLRFLMDQLQYKSKQINLIQQQYRQLQDRFQNLKIIINHSQIYDLQAKLSKQEDKVKNLNAQIDSLKKKCSIMQQQIQLNQIERNEYRNNFIETDKDSQQFQKKSIKSENKKQQVSINNRQIKQLKKKIVQITEANINLKYQNHIVKQKISNLNKTSQTFQLKIHELKLLIFKQLNRQLNQIQLQEGQIFQLEKKPTSIKRILKNIQALIQNKQD